MPAVINFTWMGDPRFMKGGQDVVGPETIDKNFKFWANKTKEEPNTSETNAEVKTSETNEEPNPMVFWCLAKHQQEYQDYFAQKGVTIEVKAIEHYIDECEVEGVDKLRVKRIFEKLLSRNEIVSYVYLKDLFFNFLLATQGGYVVDTNVQANLGGRVQFPEYSTSVFPFVIKDSVAEVWMQYAPPHNLTRAQQVLNCYLSRFETFVESKGNLSSREFHDAIGQIAVGAICLMESEPITHKMNPKKLKTAQCDLWMCDYTDEGCLAVPGFNVHKEYANSHRPNREDNYGPVHIHVYNGNVEKLKFDLEHKISPNLLANPKNAETEEGYDAKNQALLHLAALYSNRENHRACLKLLLENGADVNLEHEYTARTEGQPFKDVPQIKTPLIYVLESKSEEAVKLLFTVAEAVGNPVRLDQILNEETPLMTAIRCNNSVAFIIEKNPDAVNQAYASEERINTPLVMALRSGQTDIIALLLQKGADPNAPIKNMKGKVQVLSAPPLHVALNNRDAAAVKLLLEYGADPWAIAEYQTSQGRLVKQCAEDIKTSPECSALLMAKLMEKLENENEEKNVVRFHRAPPVAEGKNDPTFDNSNTPWYATLFNKMWCGSDSALPEERTITKKKPEASENSSGKTFNQKR